MQQPSSNPSSMMMPPSSSQPPNSAFNPNMMVPPRGPYMMPMHPSQQSSSSFPPTYHPQQGYGYGPSGGIPNYPSQHPHPSPHPQQQQQHQPSLPTDGSTMGGPSYPYPMNNTNNSNIPNIPRPMMYPGPGYPSNQVPNMSSSVSGSNNPSSYPSSFPMYPGPYPPTQPQPSVQPPLSTPASSSALFRAPVTAVGSLPTASMHTALETNALLFGELHALSTKYASSKRTTVIIPEEDQKRMNELRTLLEKRVRALAAIADKVALANRQQAIPVSVIKKDDLRIVLDPLSFNKDSTLPTLIWGKELDSAIEFTKNLRPLPINETLPDILGNNNSSSNSNAAATTLSSSAVSASNDVSMVPGDDGKDTKAVEEKGNEMVTE